MTEFRLEGGPRDDEIVEEIPDGYQATGVGRGAGGDLNVPTPITAVWAAAKRSPSARDRLHVQRIRAMRDAGQL